MKVIIFLLLLFILSGCNFLGRNAYDKLIVITEFDNVFDKETGNILFSNLLITDIIFGEDTLIVRKRREFFYDSIGNRIRVNEYRADYITGDKVLNTITLYDDLSETLIFLNGNDTTFYSRVTFDSTGKNVLSIRDKRNSEFAITDMLMLYEYDDDGRIIRHSRLDFLTGREEIFKYTHEKLNDTLRTRIYLDNRLFRTRKKISQPYQSVEYSFDSSGELYRIFEVLRFGELEIEVTRDLKFHSTDSIFFKNDNIIREVMSQPGWHAVVTTEYDIHGNPLLEIRENILYDSLIEVPEIDYIALP
jgi:uncharacterized protein YqfB (UPF0267 family)